MRGNGGYYYNMMKEYYPMYLIIDLEYYYYVVALLFIWQSCNYVVFHQYRNTDTSTGTRLEWY